MPDTGTLSEWERDRGIISDHDPQARTIDRHISRSDLPPLIRPRIGQRYSFDLERDDKGNVRPTRLKFLPQP